MKEAGHCQGNWSETSLVCPKCAAQQRCEIETRDKIKRENKRHQSCWGCWKEEDTFCKKCEIQSLCMREAGKVVATPVGEIPKTPFEYLLDKLRQKFDEQKMVEDDENAVVFCKKGKPVIGLMVGQNGNIAIKSHTDAIKLDILESKEQVDRILSKLL